MRLEIEEAGLDGRRNGITNGRSRTRWERNKGERIIKKR
jgi:hypothetical protein